MNRVCTWVLLVMLTGWWLVPKAAGLGPDDYCWVCGKPLGNEVYMWKDEVAGVKRRLCEDCVELPNACYVCSLPVKTNYVDLKDGRFLCERDAKSVLLDEGAISNVCIEAKAALDTQFSRFLALPDNVTFHVADRVTLLDLFKVPGKDYTCPNVLGFTSPQTNDQNQVEYSISILSGQSAAATEATCAHELSHAWMMAKLPEARHKSLNRDAVEGFCELVAYMLMRDKGETTQMADIRTNLYTRGQIDLFIDAEQRFGFSDVLDWMRYGLDDKLQADKPWLMHNVAMPQRTNVVTASVLPLYLSKPVDKLHERLVLKSISVGGRAPLALINQCTLGVGETGKVKLASTNLTIRCKEIRLDSVVIELVGSGEQQELHFESHAEDKAVR